MTETRFPGDVRQTPETQDTEWLPPQPCLAKIPECRLSFHVSARHLLDQGMSQGLSICAQCGAVAIDPWTWWITTAVMDGLNFCFVIWSREWESAVGCLPNDSRHPPFILGNPLPCDAEHKSINRRLCKVTVVAGKVEFTVDLLVRMIRCALVPKLTHLPHYSTMWRS